MSEPEVKVGQVWERKEGALRLIVQHVGEIYVTVTDPDDKGASIRREALLDHYRLVWPDAPTDAELATRWYEADGTWITLPRAEVIERRKAAAAELARLRADALTRGERAELLAWRLLESANMAAGLTRVADLDLAQRVTELRAENEAASGGGDGDSAAVGPNPGVKPADSTATDPSPPAAEPEPTDNDPDPSITEMGRRARESWGRENPWDAQPAGRAAAEPPPTDKPGLVGALTDSLRQALANCEAAAAVAHDLRGPLGRRSIAWPYSGMVPDPAFDDGDTGGAGGTAATYERAAAADAPDMVAVRREDVLDAARCARGMLMLALEGRLRAAAERAAEGR